MYKKSTSSFLATSLMLSIATASMPAIAAVVNAEWINGSGNYSDDTKWNIPAVPCNAGSTTFNVNIPANSGTIYDDVPICAVDTFILGDSSTFKILTGSSYTVLGQVVLNGSVQVNGIIFTGLGHVDIFDIISGVGGDFMAPIAALLKWVQLSLLLRRYTRQRDCWGRLSYFHQRILGPCWICRHYRASIQDLMMAALPYLFIRSRLRMPA
jgi:hypothetical protein